jgi:hypothetical protein
MTADNPDARCKTCIYFRPDPPADILVATDSGPYPVRGIAGDCRWHGERVGRAWTCAHFGRALVPPVPARPA